MTGTAAGAPSSDAPDRYGGLWQQAGSRHPNTSGTIRLPTRRAITAALDTGHEHRAGGSGPAATTAVARDASTIAPNSVSRVTVITDPTGHAQNQPPSHAAERHRAVAAWPCRR